MTETLAKGSWWQRFSIYSLSVLLAVLVFWLLGFGLQDLETLPGPQLSSYTLVVEQSLLKQQADRLDQQIGELQKEVATVQQQQVSLKTAMGNTQNTINQILEIQRLNAEKGQAASADLAKAFQQNTQLFLAEQNELQQINAALSELNLQILPLQFHRQTVSQKLDEDYKQANAHYQQAYAKHRLNMGTIQVGLLIVLLLIVVLFLLNRSSSYYRPIWMAMSFAILIKIFLVLHDYFPSRYFKYILTVSLIMVVIMALSDLLKRRAFPAKSYLLKQFRDAYEHFLCPMCEYPIRRGPLRYVFWTRRSLKKLQVAQDHTDDSAPYNCPHCGTLLYQSCQSCQHIRHALLPYCEHCGTQSAT